MQLCFLKMFHDEKIITIICINIFYDKKQSEFNQKMYILSPCDICFL